MDNGLSKSVAQTMTVCVSPNIPSQIAPYFPKAHRLSERTQTSFASCHQVDSELTGIPAKPSPFEDRPFDVLQIRVVPGVMFDTLRLWI